MNILEKIEQISTSLHEHQFRKDKVTPYIVHPRAVRDNIKNYLDLFEDIKKIRLLPFNISKIILFGQAVSFSDYKTIIESVALMHDTEEDVSGFLSDILFESLKCCEDYRYNTVMIIVQGIKCLTKNPDRNQESYLSYLRRVKMNPIARLVKIEDIRHNLSDLPNGTQRDKYMLAEHFLLN